MHSFLKYSAYTFAAITMTELLTHYYAKYFVRPRKDICDVYFLNEESSCSRVIDRIVQEIDSAKSIICIAMYMFTSQRLCDAIIKAKRRGVIVRIIMDYSQRSVTGSKWKEFEKAGIAVRININEGPLMHHKFSLIDVITSEKIDWKNKHPFDGLLINGSLNWTNNGINKNWENVTFQTEKTIKTQFKLEFDRLWNSSTICGINQASIDFETDTY